LLSSVTGGLSVVLQASPWRNIFWNLGPKNMSDLPEVKLTLEHKAHPDITGPDRGLLLKILHTYQAAVLKNGHKIGL
jgi:hypothetical protein